MHLSLRRNTGVEDARHRCATFGPSRDEGRNPVTGVAVKGKDRAGGKQSEQAHDWFRLDDDPVVTVGDTVEPHGTHTPAPTMVEGESWFRVGGRPVCRAENKASCGHATTGRQWFRLTRADNGYRPYLTNA